LTALILLPALIGIANGGLVLMLAAWLAILNTCGDGIPLDISLNFVAVGAPAKAMS
jgi:hypothetical protein